MEMAEAESMIGRRERKTASSSSFTFDSCFREKDAPFGCGHAAAEDFPEDAFYEPEFSGDSCFPLVCGDTALLRLRVWQTMYIPARGYFPFKIQYLPLALASQYH